MGAHLIDLAGPFVWAPGTVFVSVRDIPEDLRRSIGADNDNDTLVSRKNSRSYSKLLNQHAASLVAHFRTPQTIGRVIARHSRSTGVIAETELEEALLVLRSLIEAQLLVPSGSMVKAAYTPSLPINSKVDGWTIARRVQAIEGVEIYRLRRSSGEYAALKVGRCEYPPAVQTVTYEGHVLSRLGCSIAPRLISLGSARFGSYLIAEWIAGKDAATVCAALRTGGRESTQALLAIIGAILRAYAALHAQGVVHGDVHPRNVMVDRVRSVRILDFGAARLLEDHERNTSPRAGVSFFFEPELAHAARTGACLPAPTVRGEQYSLAALAYLLLTGHHYLDFIVEENAMLRQIADDAMLSLSRREIPVFAEVEPVLRTALSKCPANRFESVGAFFQAWEAASLKR